MQGVQKNGAKRIRTADPLHAMQVLYQLSYGPMNVACIACHTFELTPLGVGAGPGFRPGARRPPAGPGW